MLFNAKTIGTIGAAADAIAARRPAASGCAAPGEVVNHAADVLREADHDLADHDGDTARHEAGGRHTPSNIIQNSGYTPVRMTANAVGALSQAHSENRVYRSGNPAGAIFICGGDARRASA
jgi:hypothetical protein